MQISAVAKTDKRRKKDNVLNKHRKWLAELQKTKERLEIDYLREMEEKEQKKFEFQEHERRMREAACSIIRDAKSTTWRSEPETSAQAKTDGHSEQDQQQKQQGADNKSQAKAVSNQRPAWAMSEAEVEERQEEKLVAEEDDLLEFTKGLDFDKYIGDLEVKTVMDRLRKRIGDLEHEVALEEYRTAEGEQRAAKREQLRGMGLTDAAIADYEQVRNDPSVEAAKRLMEQEEAQGLQDIHSARSVAAMLKQAQEKIDKAAAANATPRTELPESPASR